MKLNDYLIHYGVKGMKWGVRKDRRQSSSSSRKNQKSSLFLKKDKRTKSNNVSDSSKQQSKQNKSLRRKKAKNMTDAELNARINRLTQEKRLHDLENSTMTAGKKMVKTVIMNSAQQTLQNVITQQATKRINKEIDKRFPT